MVDIEGRSIDVAVHWREMGGELAAGLGMPLEMSFAGMKSAWSKCVACGSMVTGLIKLGGEIMDGSSGGRVPGLDCFLRELCALVPRDKLGSVGCGFLLLDEEDMLDVSYFIVRVVVESLEGSAGVVGRVDVVDNGATGGGGGREYWGGVDAPWLNTGQGTT